MNTISERIRLIMDRKKVSTKELAGWLGITDSRVRQKFSDNNWDSLKEITDISDKTGYAFNWIAEGTGPEMEKDSFQALDMAKNFGIDRLSIIEPGVSEVKSEDAKLLKDLVDSQKETIEMLKREIKRLENEVEIKNSKEGRKGGRK